MNLTDFRRWLCDKHNRKLQSLSQEELKRYADDFHKYEMEEWRQKNVVKPKTGL